MTEVAAVWVKAAELTPWSDNPRVLDEGHVAQVAASIEAVAAEAGTGRLEDGFGAPIVARLADREIIAGHTRLRAALLLGMERVPVRFLDLPEGAAHRLARADNRLTEVGQWDHELLINQLIADRDIDAALLEQQGWTASDLDVLVRQHIRKREIEDPSAGEPPKTPTTKSGDVWLLGDHRLACGDSTEESTLRAALGGNAPELMVTDPPYGVGYDPQWRVDAADKGQLSYTARRTGAVPNDDRADWSAAWALSPSTVAYVWYAAGPLSAVVLRSLHECGYEARAQIIWAKRHFPIGRGHYHVRHEPCWYAVKRGASADWVGDRKQSTLWDDITLDRNVGMERGGHGTQKPIECMARPIRNHSGDVYDPFVGSGTTIVAAEQLERRCYAIELSPGYCDVAVDRWQNLTGQKARRKR